MARKEQIKQLFARFKDYFPAELMIDLEGHVERFFADRASSATTTGRAERAGTGHLLGFNSWGRSADRRREHAERRLEKVLGREALSAHCYHLYAVIFCRNDLQPELTPPFHFRRPGKSPEPELRQLAAELRLIEAINYFAPQETAQLIRPLLPLSKKEAANKKKGKKEGRFCFRFRFRGLVEDHQDDEDEGDLAGYMKRALAGDNRPPKVRLISGGRRRAHVDADVQQTRNFSSVFFVFAVFIFSFAASSSVLSSSFASFSSSSSKDAKKGSTKTSDEKACFSSMKTINLVIKKDPNNSGGGGFVLDPASSSTMIGGGGGAMKNSELEKTKVVPSAAAAADAVSSKEEPEPNISTEVFNELSSFVTYVEAMLADLDAKKGSKFQLQKLQLQRFQIQHQLL
ncbi:hypothetical protein TYRP_023290 [Tyrophagus putrescentiae]|nr:hypothetical protein TYRP_023290 [Tyrophagus putrescentiae]